MVSDGGLGSHIVGDRINIGEHNYHITKLLGEGGFSYVYLVKELVEGTGISQSLHVDKAKDMGSADMDGQRRNSGSGAGDGSNPYMVMKVTSIHSRSQRDIAEKEAKLLSRLSHPSIVKMYDTCYRQIAHATVTNKRGKEGTSNTKERPQHIILMEYCEGGHALDVCNKLSQAGKQFDLSTLIIAFGQICNAVSYLHAQRPPIVHRDLKPVNFLVKNGAYKLCDFGSAVFGHVDLRTQKGRAEAEEVIQKTTTQMFRAPEMIDLYMAKKLTQATDVWALGCCLYSMAFLQNCFEEGSNLAILSGKYTIPDDNPYGEGLVELLDRMLTADYKARADMTEVILCLSAVYSGRQLPPRKKQSKAKKEEAEGEEKLAEEKAETKTGTYRTDGQGIQEQIYDPTKKTEAKKLASNSVAARRKRAAQQNVAAATQPTAPSSSATGAKDTTTENPINFDSFDSDFVDIGSGKNGEEAFASTSFGDMKGFDASNDGGGDAFFGSFETDNKAPATGGTATFNAAFDSSAWGEAPAPASEPVEATPAPAEPVVLTGEQRALAALRKAKELQEKREEEMKSEHDSQPIASIQPSQDILESGEESSKRRDRSSRRRGGGGRPSRSGLEKDMDAMHIDDGMEHSGRAERRSSHEKGSRSRRTRREDDDERKKSSRRDDEEERKRSNSRSRRKPHRGSREMRRPSDDRREDSSRQDRGPRKAGSLRNLNVA